MLDRDVKHGNRARAISGPAGTAFVAPGPAVGMPIAGWRDDLRLFGYAWAAGFVFFMVVLA